MSNNVAKYYRVATEEQLHNGTAPKPVAIFVCECNEKSLEQQIASFKDFAKSNIMEVLVVEGGL